MHHSDLSPENTVLAWFARAAERGNAYAQLNLG
jgi:TPR repeat protein